MEIIQKTELEFELVTATLIKKEEKETYLSLRYEVKAPDYDDLDAQIAVTFFNEIIDIDHCCIQFMKKKDLTYVEFELLYRILNKVIGFYTPIKK